MRVMHEGRLQKIITAIAILLIAAIAVAVPLGSKIQTGSWRPVLDIGEAHAASPVQQANGKGAAPPAPLGNCNAVGHVAQGERQTNCVHKTVSGQTPVNAPRALLTVSVGDLATFYETIITILGVALAIVAGLAYWSVRLVSVATAEEIAMKAAEKIVTDSKRFSDLINSTIQRYVDKEIDRLREGLEPIEGMEKRITSIEEKIAKVDNSENIVGRVEEPREKE